MPVTAMHKTARTLAVTLVVFTLSSEVHADTVKIKILDSHGDPIPGASVIIGDGKPMVAVLATKL
jgi:hypothetical protein